LFAEKENDKKSADLKEEKVTVPEHKRAKRKKRGVGKELPVVLEVIDLAAEEKIAADGKAKIQMGHIDTDKIEYTPERLYIHRIRRLKYISASEAKDNENTVFSVPPLPPQIAPKSIFTPSLLAYLVVTKFLDALPLNRMERRFKRYGYLLSRATMVNGLLNVAKKCEVLVDLLLKEAVQGSFLLMDETPFQVHGEHGRVNKAKSWIWVMYGGPPEKPIFIFKYHPERNHKIPLHYLSFYKGFIQTDGFDAYNAVGDLPDIIHVVCWVHARRFYASALKMSEKKDNLATEAIDLIAQLFRIEKRLRKEKLSDDEFLARRKREVEPIFEAIRLWILKNKDIVSPTSLVGKGIHYMVERWDKLIKYIDCPHLTPSTNKVEGIIRTVVIGRKNYLFFGSPRGAYAGMTFYSLIETARANGLEPYKYLKYIFTKLPYASTEEEYKKLLPQFLDMDAFNQFDMEKDQAVIPSAV
jgi:transposase